MGREIKRVPLDWVPSMVYANGERYDDIESAAL